MTMLIYVLAAIVFLILVRKLMTKPRAAEYSSDAPHHVPLPNNPSGHWLELSERIFDSSDARWLADELAFPGLAATLTQGRKRLAVLWLRSLEASFDELVRMPEPYDAAAPRADHSQSWHLLWLTLRFKLLVSYALLVVRLFGPYHRLIPSFSWFPFSPTGLSRSRRMAWAHSRGAR